MRDLRGSASVCSRRGEARGVSRPWEPSGRQAPGAAPEALSHVEDGEVADGPRGGSSSRSGGGGCPAVDGAGFVSEGEGPSSGRRGRRAWTSRIRASKTGWKRRGPRQYWHRAFLSMRVVMERSVPTKRRSHRTQWNSSLSSPWPAFTLVLLPDSLVSTSSLDMSNARAVSARSRDPIAVRPEEGFASLTASLDSIRDIPTPAPTPGPHPGPIRVAHRVQGRTSSRYSYARVGWSFNWNLHPLARRQ